MKNNLKIVTVTFLVFLSHLLSFNWIIGSAHATFSWSSMMAPAVASNYGFGFLALFFISKKIYSLSLAGLGLLMLHRLPLVFSARAFEKREIFTSFVVPAFCIMLFSFHEVGSQVWYYSCYWFIPMVLYFASNSSWSRALSASFVAHGVGSVVWLYAVSIPASFWIALIPVVVVERLLIAGGMLVCDYLVSRLVSLEFFQGRKDFIAGSCGQATENKGERKLFKNKLANNLVVLRFFKTLSDCFSSLNVSSNGALLVLKKDSPRSYFLWLDHRIQYLIKNQINTTLTGRL